jgi:hypothetical protein
LPNILDAARILADQAGDDVLFKIGNDCLLATVEGSIANAMDPLICLDFQRHEIATWAADDHSGAFNLHGGYGSSISVEGDYTEFILFCLSNLDNIGLTTFVTRYDHD